MVFELFLGTGAGLSVEQTRSSGDGMGLGCEMFGWSVVKKNAEIMCRLQNARFLSLLSTVTFSRNDRKSSRERKNSAQFRAPV